MLNVPGTWDIWEGTVYERVPIINWVRNEGEDTTEQEFDIMDFVRDPESRGLPGRGCGGVSHPSGLLAFWTAQRRRSEVVRTHGTGRGRGAGRSRSAGRSGAVVLHDDAA